MWIVGRATIRKTAGLPRKADITAALICQFAPRKKVGRRLWSDMSLYILQMKKIARRQSEDAQGGEKSKKNTKSSTKLRKVDDTAGR